MKRLAIITTHPIQYNAPLFKLLEQRQNIHIKVFYTWGQSNKGVIFDRGFKKNIQWDRPLLDGYNYEFIKNISIAPGSHHFFGIINQSLIQKINKFNPTCILIYGWNYFSHVKTLMHFYGKIPVFFRGDSTLIDSDKESFFKKGVKKWLLTKVFSCIDKAFYVGLENKKYFLKYGLKEKQLILAKHSVDNQYFTDSTNGYLSEARSLKNEFKIPENDIVFLFAGKFQNKKDPHLLLSVFKSLPESDIHLIFVGNGELEVELKTSALDDRRIHFLDFQNQSRMPIIYRMADIFVLPSKGPGETWGLSVNEAMACGCAIIVSNRCGCHCDLINNNGYIFNSGSYNSLRDAMIQMIAKKEYLFSFKKKSLEIIQEYSYESIVYTIENAVLSESSND